MSTIYNGKINFSKNELMTKYDRISLLDNIQIQLTFPCIKATQNFHKPSNKEKLPLNIKNSFEKINQKVEEKKVECKRKDIKAEDWLDPISDQIEFSYCFEADDHFQLACKYCLLDDSKIIFTSSLVKYKMEFINAIIQCILYGLKGGSELLSLCERIKSYDPEFLLKTSLFCRREFNVRTVSNYLLALAASLPQCNIYLKKYFSTCVNLPTDWMEVVQQYMIMSKSIKLPAQLRRVLVSKFKDFNTYQIGKYQHKRLEVDIETKKIKLTLKSLIRTLHISEPVDHVMCLLGKNYPKSNEEFVASNLPGEWDQDKAGKRMKVATPETWETQISINGNKPEVWEKLIDTKKLPYMAMIRNLRNILQANVKDKYHDKVCHAISQESKVVNGKMLPFQYFTAFKVLEEYNEDILKAKDKLAAFYVKDPADKAKGKTKGRGKKGNVKDPNEKRDRIRKIVRLRKIMGRPIVSENIIEKYTKALNKAVEISTTYNIPCIRGRVLILSNIVDESIYSKFKYGTSKSVKEVVALLTSMCYFASEYTEIGLVNDSKMVFYKLESRAKSLLTLSSDILKHEFLYATKVDKMFEEMISKQIHYDLILLIDVTIERDLLLKYSKLVNSSVSIFINNIASNGDKVFDCENISTMSGFNEHIIKIISEQSNGGFVRKVDSIDKRYNLVDGTVCFKSNNTHAENDIDLSCVEEHSEPSHVTDINIFISSTFLDMEKERSFINKFIIPAVKKQLKLKNINFLNVNCIDLRWGVPFHLGCSEEMLKYCIEQVKRCNVFVGILGKRYGWIPDFDILANLSDTYPELADFESHSITHLEYKFAPRNSHKIFLLQSLTEVSRRDGNLEEFHNEIKNNETFYEYSPENLSTDFQVLIPFIIKTVRDNFVGEDSTMSQICMKHQRLSRQKLVKKSLNHFLKYSTGKVSTQKDSIDEVIALLEHDLKIKVKLFCERKKRDECNNTVDKKKIVAKEEMMDSLGGVVLIEGKIGCGKTSLMAGILQEFKSPKYEIKHNISGKINRQSFVWFYDSIKHIYDENGKRVTLYDLLYDMIEFLMSDLGYNFTDKLKQELGIYGDDCEEQDFWKPTDIRSALPVWRALLKILSMVDGIQVTFFLDGLDELEDSADACSLTWIPLTLSSKVRFVISAVADSVLSRCTKSRNDYITYEVKPIATKFKRAVIESLLMAQGKSLDLVPFNDQMAEFTLKSDSDKPKYLELAINYLLLYATFDKVKETIKSMPSTYESLIMHSLKSLEKEIPKEICMVYFSFIRHSRSGLRNEDLQKLISIYFMALKKKHNVALNRSDFQEIKVASTIPAGFSLFPLMLIRNYSNLLLEEGRNQRIFIKDKTIRSVICRYCEPVNSQIIHYILSLYYGDLIERTSDSIAFRDIIYHKYHASMFEECLVLLTDANFVKDRFELGLADGLLEDYMGYQDHGESSNEQWLKVSYDERFVNSKNFIARNFTLLSENADLFLQQAINEPSDGHVRRYYGDANLKRFEFTDDTPILKLERSNCNKLHPSVVIVSDRVTCAALSTELMLLVVGYEGGLIQIFSTINFQMVSNLRQHILRVNSICFIERSNKIVSVGEDNKSLVWSSQDGSLLHELSGHYRSVTDCAICVKANLICTTGLDAQCLLWKQDSYQLHHTFKSGSPINCVTVCNSKILIGCWDGNMIIYNAIDLVRTAVIHNSSSVRSVSINESYPTFLATNIEGHIRVWNSVKGTKLQDLSSGYHKYPTSGIFSSDGLTMFEYAGNNSGHQAIMVRNASIGCHENARKVEDVCCIDSNDSYIVCGTRYGKLVVLDSVTLKPISSDSVSESELTAISINNSKLSFKDCGVIADYYNSLIFFEIISSTIILKLKLENVHDRAIRSLVWSSSYIVSGGEDCFVNIVQMKKRSTNDFMFSIKDLFRNSVLTVDIRKGRILAGSKDKSIGLFSITDKSILNHHIQAHDDWVTCVRFLSSVSFVSGANDFSVKIWQMSMEAGEDNNRQENNQLHFSSTQVTFTVMHTLIGHMGHVTSLSIMTDQYVASSSSDGTIKVWLSQGLFSCNLMIDHDNGQVLENVNPMLWVKYNGGRLLSLDSLDNIHTFNTNGNYEINELTCHKGPVTGVLSTDSLVYTVSVDSSIRQWDFNEILSKNTLTNYRIVQSLYIAHCRGHSDVIVACSDTGFLLYMDKDSVRNIWTIFDLVDMKETFEEHERHGHFTSPYLICQALVRHNDSTIDILFGHLTLRHNIQNMSLTKTTFKDPAVTTVVDVECNDVQVNENQFLKIVNDGEKCFFVRVAKRSQFLELFSLQRDTNTVTYLTKTPLSGEICHMMVFESIDGGHNCLVGYEQGTFEVVALMAVTN